MTSYPSDGLNSRAPSDPLTNRPIAHLHPFRGDIGALLPAPKGGSDNSKLKLHVDILRDHLEALKVRY